MAEELLFKDVEVGKEYPPFAYELEKEAVEKYISAVEDEQITKLRSCGEVSHDAVPPAVASIYFMQSYYEAFANRPKGNIHAKQNFRFLREVHVGDRLTTLLKVKDKYVKKERKFVLIDILSQNQKNETVLTGTMTVIWAR